MSAFSEPEVITFAVPALVTWRRSGGRPDPTAPRTSKLVGYYTRGATPNYTRLSEYQSWKDHVRAHSPPGLLRLRPVDEASRVRLDVVCHFATKTHADPENVRKGIVDALFPGGDKWVYGSHDHPRYDPARPRVEVTVTTYAGARPAAAPTRVPAAGRVAAEARTKTRPRSPAPQAESAPAEGTESRPRKKASSAASPAPPSPPVQSTKASKTSKSKAAPPPVRQGPWATLVAFVARLSEAAGKDRGRSGAAGSRRAGKRRK